MNNEKKFSLTEIWYLLLTLMLPFICVAGASPVPYALRPWLIYAMGIGFILVFVFSDIKINMNPVSVTAFLLVAFMSASWFYSYDPASTKSLLVIYLCSFTLLFNDIPIKRTSQIMSIMYVFCIIIALSIVASLFANNLMLNYFSFIVNPQHSPDIVRSITRELNDGSYSGFARVRSDAAFIMNVGIAVCYARFFANGKFKKTDLVSLALFFVALMLTGRRMLFLVCIVCFALFMLISNIKNRLLKGIIIFLLSSSAMLLAAMLIPQVSNFFARFLDKENLSTLSNRDMLWDSMISMFKSHPIFGAGFNSYNEYAFNHGLLVGNHEWVYNGHNTYLQILAELGIVGFLMMMIFMIVTFFQSIVLLKKFSKDVQQAKIIYFSIYIQVLIAVYGLTGNPLYSRQMVVIWFLSAGIITSAYRKIHPVGVNSVRMIDRRHYYGQI